MFSTRILKTDHYQGIPIKNLDVCYSDFRDSDVYQVPVLRIYGITPLGQKTCVHIHGVFPYLYVPYDGSEPLERHLKQFASSVDKALNVALGRSASNAHHVYKIALVSGIPFYGYHEQEIPFLKIYLYNPLMVKKVADLLLGGAVMNKIYQPHESHIPYNLQFFMDYNLYGMNMINVGAVKFRQPANSDWLDNSGNRSLSSGSLSLLYSATSRTSPLNKTKWDTENIPEDLWLDKSVERQSVCELEADVVATDILNRLEVGDNVGSNPGLAALWDDERQRRTQRDMDLDLEPPGSPERGDIPWTDAEARLQERFAEIVEQLRPYISKESESSQVESSLSYPATPSSQVEQHASQTDLLQEESSSQDSVDTVILESPVAEEAPVVNQQRILRIVSSSQSFSKHRESMSKAEGTETQVLDTTQDMDLAQLLASMADADPCGGDEASQRLSEVSSRLSELEEQDSVLSQLKSSSSPPDEDSREEDETLEMSQAVWHDQDQESTGCEGEFDLEGMDISWNSSAWQPVEEEREEARGSIPQLDGPIEENAVSVPLKKRLGMRGPASLTTAFNMTVYSEARRPYKGFASNAHHPLKRQNYKTRDVRVCLTDISSVLGSVIERKQETLQYLDTTVHSPQPQLEEIALDLRHSNMNVSCSPATGSATDTESDHSDDTDLKSYLDTNDNKSLRTVCGVSDKTSRITPKQINLVEISDTSSQIATCKNQVDISQTVSLIAQNDKNHSDFCDTTSSVAQNDENHMNICDNCIEVTESDENEDDIDNSSSEIVQNNKSQINCDTQAKEFDKRQVNLNDNLLQVPESHGSDVGVSVSDCPVSLTKNNPSEHSVHSMTSEQTQDRSQFSVCGIISKATEDAKSQVPDAIQRKTEINQTQAGLGNTTSDATLDNQSQFDLAHITLEDTGNKHSQFTTKLGATDTQINESDSKSDPNANNKIQGNSGESKLCSAVTTNLQNVNMVAQLNSKGSRNNTSQQGLGRPGPAVNQLSPGRQYSQRTSKLKCLAFLKEVTDSNNKKHVEDSCSGSKHSDNKSTDDGSCVSKHSDKKPIIDSSSHCDKEYIADSSSRSKNIDKEHIEDSSSDPPNTEKKVVEESCSSSENSDSECSSRSNSEEKETLLIKTILQNPKLPIVQLKKIQLTECSEVRVSGFGTAEQELFGQSNADVSETKSCKSHPTAISPGSLNRRRRGSRPFSDGGFSTKIRAQLKDIDKNVTSQSLQIEQEVPSKAECMDQPTCIDSMQKIQDDESNQVLTGDNLDYSSFRLPYEFQGQDLCSHANNKLDKKTPEANQSGIYISEDDLQRTISIVPTKFMPVRMSSKGELKKCAQRVNMDSAKNSAENSPDRSQEKESEKLNVNCSHLSVKVEKDSQDNCTDMSEQNNTKSAFSAVTVAKEIIVDGLADPMESEYLLVKPEDVTILKKWNSIEENAEPTSDKLSGTGSQFEMDCYNRCILNRRQSTSSSDDDLTEWRVGPHLKTYGQRSYRPVNPPSNSLVFTKSKPSANQPHYSDISADEAAIDDRSDAEIQEHWDSTGSGEKSRHEGYSNDSQYSNHSTHKGNDLVKNRDSQMSLGGFINKTNNVPWQSDVHSNEMLNTRCTIDPRNMKNACPVEQNVSGYLNIGNPIEFERTTYRNTDFSGNSQYHNSFSQMPFSEISPTGSKSKFENDNCVESQQWQNTSRDQIQPSSVTDRSSFSDRSRAQIKAFDSTKCTENHVSGQGDCQSSIDIGGNISETKHLGNINVEQEFVSELHKVDREYSEFEKVITSSKTENLTEETDGDFPRDRSKAIGGKLMNEVEKIGSISDIGLKNVVETCKSADAPIICEDDTDVCILQQNNCKTFKSIVDAEVVTDVKCRTANFGSLESFEFEQNDSTKRVLQKELSQDLKTTEEATSVSDSGHDKAVDLESKISRDAGISVLRIVDNTQEGQKDVERDVVSLRQHFNSSDTVESDTDDQNETPEPVAIVSDASDYVDDADADKHLEHSAILSKSVDGDSLCYNSVEDTQTSVLTEGQNETYGPLKVNLLICETGESESFPMESFKSDSVTCASGSEHYTVVSVKELPDNCEFVDYNIMQNLAEETSETQSEFPDPKKELVNLHNLIIKVPEISGMNSDLTCPELDTECLTETSEGQKNALRDDGPPELVNELENCMMQNSRALSKNDSSVETFETAPILVPFEGETLASDISGHMIELESSVLGKNTDNFNDKDNSVNSDESDEGPASGQTEDDLDIQQDVFIETENCQEEICQDSAIHNEECEDVVDLSKCYTNKDVHYDSDTDVLDLSVKSREHSTGSERAKESHNKALCSAENFNVFDLSAAVESKKEHVERSHPEITTFSDAVIIDLPHAIEKPHQSSISITRNLSECFKKFGESLKSTKGRNSGQATTLAEKKEKLRLKREEKQQQQLLKEPGSLPVPTKRFENAFDMLNNALYCTKKESRLDSETLNYGCVKEIKKGRKPGQKNKNGSKFRSENKVLKRTKSVEAPNKRSVDECVSYPYCNKTFYVNGMSTATSERHTRHISTSVEGTVRVLKLDCQEYNLTMVGKEKLCIPVLSDSRIKELKEQVRLEVTQSKETEVNSTTSIKDDRNGTSPEKCFTDVTFCGEANVVDDEVSEGDSEVSDSETVSSAAKERQNSPEASISIDLRGFTACKMLSEKQAIPDLSDSENKTFMFSECIEMKRKEVLSTNVSRIVKNAKAETNKTDSAKGPETVCNTDGPDKGHNTNDTKKVANTHDPEKVAKINDPETVAYTNDPEKEPYSDVLEKVTNATGLLSSDAWVLKKSQQRKDQKSKDFGFLFGRGDAIVPSLNHKKKPLHSKKDKNFENFSRNKILNEINGTKPEENPAATISNKGEKHVESKYVNATAKSGCVQSPVSSVSSVENQTFEAMTSKPRDRLHSKLSLKKTKGQSVKAKCDTVLWHVKESLNDSLGDSKITTENDSCSEPVDSGIDQHCAPTQKHKGCSHPVDKSLKSCQQLKSKQTKSSKSRTDNAEDIVRDKVTKLDKNTKSRRSRHGSSRRSKKPVGSGKVIVHHSDKSTDNVKAGNTLQQKTEVVNIQDESEPNRKMSLTKETCNVEDHANPSMIKEIVDACPPDPMLPENIAEECQNQVADKHPKKSDTDSDTSALNRVLPGNNPEKTLGANVGQCESFTETKEGKARSPSVMKSPEKNSHQMYTEDSIFESSNGSDFSVVVSYPLKDIGNGLNTSAKMESGSNSPSCTSPDTDSVITNLNLINNSDTCSKQGEADVGNNEVSEEPKGQAEVVDKDFKFDNEMVEDISGYDRLRCEEVNEGKILHEESNGAEENEDISVQDQANGVEVKEDLIVQDEPRAVDVDEGTVLQKETKDVHEDMQEESRVDSTEIHKENQLVCEITEKHSNCNTLDLMQGVIDSEQLHGDCSATRYGEIEVGKDCHVKQYCDNPPVSDLTFSGGSVEDSEDHQDAQEGLTYELDKWCEKETEVSMKNQKSHVECNDQTTDADAIPESISGSPEGGKKNTEFLNNESTEFVEKSVKQTASVEGLHVESLTSDDNTSSIENISEDIDHAEPVELSSIESSSILDEQSDNSCHLKKKKHHKKRSKSNKKHSDSNSDSCERYKHGFSTNDVRSKGGHTVDDDVQNSSFEVSKDSLEQENDKGLLSRRSGLLDSDSSSDIKNTSTLLRSEFRKRTMEENTFDMLSNPPKKVALVNEEHVKERNGLMNEINQERVEEVDHLNSFENIIRRQIKEARTCKSGYKNESDLEFSHEASDSIEFKKTTKKRKLPNRLDSAFCKPSSSRKRKMTEKKKFKDTLSLLHQATVDNLKSDDLNSPTSSDASNEHLISMKDLECSMNTAQCMSESKYVQLDVYGHNVNRDYSLDYADVMSKLAYLSSVKDEISQSPPTTWSPSRDSSEQIDLAQEKSSSGIIFQYGKKPCRYLSSMHMLEKYSNNQLVNGHFNERMASKSNDRDLSPEIPLQGSTRNTVEESINRETENNCPSPLSSQNTRSPHSNYSSQPQSPEALTNLQESKLCITEIPGSPQNIHDCPASPEAHEITGMKSDLKEIPSSPQELINHQGSPVLYIDNTARTSPKCIESAGLSSHSETIRSHSVAIRKEIPANIQNSASHGGVLKADHGSAFVKVKKIPVIPPSISCNDNNPHNSPDILEQLGSNNAATTNVFGDLPTNSNIKPLSTQAPYSPAVPCVTETLLVKMNVPDALQIKEIMQCPEEMCDGPMSPLPEDLSFETELREIPSSPTDDGNGPLSPPLSIPFHCEGLKEIPSSPVELSDAPLSPVYRENSFPHHLKEIPSSPVDVSNLGYALRAISPALLQANVLSQKLPSAEIVPSRSSESIQYLDLAQSEIQESLRSPSPSLVESSESIRSPYPEPIKSRSPSPQQEIDHTVPSVFKAKPVEIPLTMDTDPVIITVCKTDSDIQKKHKRIGHILHERMKLFGHLKQRSTSPYGTRGGGDHHKLNTKRPRLDSSSLDEKRNNDPEVIHKLIPENNIAPSQSANEVHVTCPALNNSVLQEHVFGKTDSSQPSMQGGFICEKSSREDNNTSKCSKSKDQHSEQDSGKQTAGQGSDSGESRHFSSQDRGCIITPVKPPPTRRFVIEDSLRLGILPEYGAFCSKPQDIPDRPRELGGKILKLDSHLVKDLPEYNSSLQGLKFWQRNLFRSHISEHMSQDTSEDILHQIQQYPQFRVAMFGDSDVTITPIKAPPSFAAVQSWMKKKQLHHELKNVTSASAVSSKTDFSKKDEKKAEKVNSNKDRQVDNVQVATKYKKGPNFKSSKKTKPTLDKVCVASPTVEVESDFKFKPISPPAVKSILKSPDPDTQFTTPTVKRTRYNPDQARDTDSPGVASVTSRLSTLRYSPAATPGFTSSTPMRRVSFEDDITAITPIPKMLAVAKSRRTSRSRSHSPTEEKHPEEDPDVDIIPPTPENPLSAKIARVKPIRRLSTGTESTLRRSLLASQIKSQNPFSTPQPRAGHDVSQIDGPTPKNIFGFRVNSQCMQDAKGVHEHQYLTVLSVEVHVRTRGERCPDPDCDPICSVVYSIFHDIPPEQGERYTTGVILVDPASASQTGGTSFTAKQASQLLLHKTGLPSVNVLYTGSERDLLEALVDLVKRFDPDILLGYEVQMLSWGFLLQRASHLSKDLTAALSRIPDMVKEKHSHKEKGSGEEHLSEIQIPGRIVLNLWQVITAEVTLNVYSFENVVYHVLHKRIPLYPFKTLTFWYDHNLHIHRWKTIEYYIIRARGNLDIIDKLDIIGQTSEFARVFGIEFYHVLSRGSQYRVESMMLRFAKPMNYVPVSPSVQQRARSRAPECIPLTMEPESKLYTDPVVVVDFQSLYPSIMIAYNYCYSTCLGRMQALQKSNEGSFEFGCTSLNVLPKQLDHLKNDISICPNGVCFVRSHIKKGILPRMVGDILKTRLMVKKSMKDYKGDQTLHRLLHARQLGLKLIANVTFGYTSANFSGRMPCMEIGDSIVRKARETLERAIELVEKTSKWGARVVYGDTDSMFIQLKGRTKDEAFKIGQEIADAVTADNPKPVKLKFEKVYLPCVLQTKKRYVGFMYETVDQKEPVFDAKGIETVRRDSCSAVAKILEKSIKILFTSHDVSQVKSFVKNQWTKLHEGKVGIQDCIFAKEYRGLHGYKPTACVPALDIAKKRLLKDRRSEPRSGERVPYVIVYGSPGLPLIQLVREPREVLRDPSLRLNATYYITKQIIPPLHRIFSLMGVDVMEWYHELPRVARTQPQMLPTTDTKKGTISQYFHSLNCPVCEEMTQHGLCTACKTDPQRTAVILNTRIRRAEKTFFQLYQVCCDCMGAQDCENSCISLDCPFMFRMNKAARDMTQVKQLTQLKHKLLQF